MRLDELWKNGIGVPPADSLVIGGIAFDIKNRRLYSKDEVNVVYEVGQEVLNDDRTQKSNAFTAYKSQYMHDQQNRAISTLGIARALITHQSTQAITTTRTKVPFTFSSNSTDVDVFALDNATDRLTLRQNVNIAFLTNLTVLGNSGTFVTPDSTTITFSLVRTSDSSVLKTESMTAVVQTDVDTLLPFVIELQASELNLSPLDIELHVQAVHNSKVTMKSFDSLIVAFPSYRTLSRADNYIEGLPIANKVYNTNFGDVTEIYYIDNSSVSGSRKPKQVFTYDTSRRITKISHFLDRSTALTSSTNFTYDSNENVTATYTIGS
jgi:putative transposon-encoded protein